MRSTFSNADRFPPRTQVFCDVAYCPAPGSIHQEPMLDHSIGCIEKYCKILAKRTRGQNWRQLSVSLRKLTPFGTFSNKTVLKLYLTRYIEIA